MTTAPHPAPVAEAVRSWMRANVLYFAHPFEVIRSYRSVDFRYDLIASLNVAVVLVPQSIAFALIANVPPQMGLYTAIVAAAVGGLWGSSRHQHSGPTNAHSLLVGAALIAVVAPGTPEFAAAAGLMAVMVGVLQLGLGLAHLGVLINFISDSVVIGFTAGAAVLIVVNQLQHLLRLTLPGTQALFYETAFEIARHAGETHGLSLGLGAATIAVIVILRRLHPRWPGAFIGMTLAALAVAVFGLDRRGVLVLGELPQTLPPLAHLPLLNLELIGRLSPGALAVAAIGLVETLSISRAIAAQSGQHIDSNQEFVGQGLANLVTGFFSGYSPAGSFSRSALNFTAGARTSLASVFSSVWVALIVLLFAPLTAFLPRTALAAVLIVTAYTMVDKREVRRIWRASRGDSLILAATFGATLFLPLEFAVLAGMLVSFGRYLVRTSMPVVRPVLPDANYRHFEYQPNQPQCPQLAVMEVRGTLYFGAVQHVEDAIRTNLDQNPSQRYLILRMNAVDTLDVTGVRMLESVARMYRKRAGDVFLVGVNEVVRKRMQLAGFVQFLGPDHFLDRDTSGLAHLFYRVLDPAVCIYECEMRAWLECQNLPKRTLPKELVLHTETPGSNVNSISPETLRRLLKSDAPPHVFDVREQREFKRGHIPDAEILPLLDLLADERAMPDDRDIVFVCRSGRRGSRAAQHAVGRCSRKVYYLEGGMLAWEAAGLLDALDE